MTTAPPDPLPVPDSHAVQLTRMEGTLNLINHQLSNVVRDVADHEKRIGGIELNVQRLGDAAVADKLTVEQTARALKDAKEATEAQARSDSQKSDQMWTPFARTMAGIATLATVVGLFFAVTSR